MTTYSGLDFWEHHKSPWPVVPLRKAARLGTGHTPSRLVEEYWVDCDIPWLTTEDLSSRGHASLDAVYETRQKISQLGLENSAAELHPAGTVMLSRTASIGHVGRIGKPMATTQAFVTWTPGPDLDSRYLTAVLVAMNPEFFRLAYGSTHLTIYMPDVEQLRVPIPPLAKQRAIADYLDAETARIDALIAKKRRMIDLLSQAVVEKVSALATGTTGTNTGFSNTEWFGGQKTSFPLRRLKYVARLESGHTPSRTRPELWEGCEFPWITLNDVGQLATVEWIERTENRISQAGLGASSARMLPAGTVVLSRDATVGRCGIMATDMATSQHFAAWVCGEQLLPRFLYLLLRYPMQSLFGSFNNGATLRTIGMPDIKEFTIPVPPVQVQDGIVRQAETLRNRSRALSESLEAQLDLLTERRQALITAAVTGELQMPGVAA